VIPLRRSIAVVAVLTMLVSACSSLSSHHVATVGDAEITEQDLADLYEVDTLPVDEDLRQTIFALIAREILLDSMNAQFGTGLDEAAVQEVYDGLVVQMEANDVDPATLLNVPGAGLGMIRFNAEISVVRDSVMESLVAEAGYLDSLFENPAAITTVCSKHILVGTEEEALAVVDRLDGGEDFATVADEVSIDTSSVGGDLGCRAANAYVEPFASTTVSSPLNELAGPIETEFGWHVLVVSERTAPTREDVAADPFNLIPSDELNSLWQTWFNDQLRAATVELESRYGTWSAVGIAPPES